MRLPYFVFLFITSLPFASLGSISVFQLTEKIFAITKDVLETSTKASDGQVKKINALLEMDSLNVQIDEIDEKFKKFNSQLNAFAKILRNIPETDGLQSSITHIRMNQYYLNSYYKEVVKYVRDFDGCSNSSLLRFADKVLSKFPNSVISMMGSIYENVQNGDFEELILKSLKPAGNGYFCIEKQSAPQMLHDFFTEILLINTKSYMVINAAYMFKKFYIEGNFRTEIKRVYEEHKVRTNNLITLMKTYVRKTTSALWTCDPTKHVSDETFIELKHFLHGFILNKSNLDPEGECSDECEVFNYRQLSNKCNNDNAWCNKEKPCRKVVNCGYVDSSMTVCPSKDNRRYDYIQFGSGRTFGKKKKCNAPTQSLETYIYWIVYRCSYCFCLCDEYDKYNTERTINLRLAASNTAGNKVVTGLRFVKHNRIIHLQVQEGKLLPFGQIEPGTIRWVPPEDYSKQNQNYHKSEDYHVFTWEERAFDLADIMADNGTVITGVQFKKVGTRIHLEVQLTPFDFVTGKLRNINFPKYDPNIERKHSSGTELKLISTDIPTRSPSPSTQFITDQYVQFTNTGYEKDAGQTTVPFFDAQAVESTIPVPLSGVGLFHKGARGYGGFITPRIFTYNFWQHLRPVFPTPGN